MRVSLTHWTDIGRARDGDQETWARLVAKYRPVVISFIGQHGLPGEAEDLAQEVFLTLHQRGLLEDASPTKGHYRSLLFALSHNLLRRHLEKRSAKKRGGGVAPAALQPGDQPSARQEEAFDRHWTLNLLEIALRRLESEQPRYHAAVSAYFFEGQSQAALAQALGLSPAGARTLVFRAKRRLLDLLREEAWHYCSSASEYADELRRLERSLGRARGK